MNYEQYLASYMEEWCACSTVQQGRAFLKFVLLYLFDRTETELENNDIDDGVLFTDGAHDRGIDCAFIDGDILYIIQGKYRNTHSYNDVYSFEKQISQFLDLSNGQALRQPLINVYTALSSDDINEIKIIYITNNYIKNERIAHEYDKICAEFNKKYSERFDKNVTLSIIGFEDYDRIHTGLLLELPRDIKNSKSKLILAKHFENRDKTTVVAEVAIKDLARLVEAHKNYIFFSNIRNFKGLNTINKAIKETYEEHPKNFWYYNNGITIVCHDYKLTERENYASVLISAPQIVNGCQTATVIYNCWRASNKQERENVDGTILVKIIQDSKGSRRKDITKFTNKQTAVTGKDFFALESFHVEIQAQFKKIGYFYEIQSNSAKVLKMKYPGNPKYQHLFDAKFKRMNAVTAKEITQVYIASILKMPAKAKNIGQFMPGNEKYGSVYNENTSTDPRFYILPYGVWYYLKKVYVLTQNNIIDNDKWSASLLYVTYVFFNIISQKYDNGQHEFSTDVFISLCEEKICDQRTFEELIEITYEVMRDFYNDSSIKKIIGDNLPKFLKSAIESNTNVQEILNDKIEGRI